MICLLKLKGEIVTLSCNHAFHHHCFQRYIEFCREKEMTCSCPICLTEYDPSGVTYTTINALESTMTGKTIQPTKPEIVILKSDAESTRNVN